MLGIIFAYSIFYGPPFVNIYAKVKITNYAKAMYGKNTKIKMIGYNFKDSSYHSVSINNENRIKFNPYQNMIVDDIVSEKISDMFQQDYLKVIESFEEEYLFPGGHIFSGIIADGKYSKDFKELKYRQRLYLLSIKNIDPYINVEESIKKPVEITRKIIDELGEKYNITGVQTIYVDVNGVFEISVKDSETLFNDINSDAIIKERIGEREKIFIESIKFKRKSNEE